MALISDLYRLLLNYGHLYKSGFFIIEKMIKPDFSNGYAHKGTSKM